MCNPLWVEFGQTVLCFSSGIQDSPLLIMLEVYELCMDYKNYSQAKIKLLTFQDSLSKVSRNLICSLRLFTNRTGRFPFSCPEWRKPGPQRIQFQWVLPGWPFLGSWTGAFSVPVDEVKDTQHLSCLLPQWWRHPVFVHWPSSCMICQHSDLHQQAHLPHFLLSLEAKAETWLLKARAVLESCLSHTEAKECGPLMLASRPGSEKSRCE